MVAKKHGKMPIFFSFLKLFTKNIWERWEAWSLAKILTLCFKKVVKFGKNKQKYPCSRKFYKILQKI